MVEIIVNPTNVLQRITWMYLLFHQKMLHPESTFFFYNNDMIQEMPGLSIPKKNRDLFESILDSDLVVFIATEPNIKKLNFNVPQQFFKILNESKNHGF